MNFFDLMPRSSNTKNFLEKVIEILSFSGGAAQILKYLKGFRNDFIVPFRSSIINFIVCVIVLKYKLDFQLRNFGGKIKRSI